MSTYARMFPRNCGYIVWVGSPNEVGKVHPKGPKDPNNRVPSKGFIGGHIGIYGDYIEVYRAQIIGF